jgi:hypothetical protein
MSTNVGSTNMMSSWKVALVLGIALGFVLATAVWNRNPGPTKAEYDILATRNVELQQQKEAQQAQFEQLETKKSLEIEQVIAQLEQRNTEIEQQKVGYEAQIAELNKKQKKLSVTQKTLDTKVVELKTTAEKQKVVLTNSKELYQQQLQLQKQVVSAKSDVEKAKATAEKFKQACDEFKSGTSWNWVSQADCDKYEQRLDLVDAEEAKVTALETELEQLNSKIEIDLPK